MLHKLLEQDLDRFLKPRYDYQVTRYPLTNLGVVEENNKLHIEIAVAGFNKDDISIEASANKLIIKGTKEDDDYGVRYIQKHISSNPFERIIVLHDDYVDGIVTASVEDGILTVQVEPKTLKKQLIEIN